MTVAQHRAANILILLSIYIHYLYLLFIVGFKKIMDHVIVGFLLVEHGKPTLFSDLTGLSIYS